ncbi:ABC transporter permease [Antrihabitans cavernicola]|uniref:Antibiotic transporter n=1 Tax=Antrihabitans cavernicola TaxID=2495913 RepID=A0A5A7SCZ7_9NOCA|nr:ABC transporter permease [Spelaeibacter cavernicola]KAA0023249.1 antibiotic transporter [Spelaeibacter cavernicola]
MTAQTLEPRPTVLQQWWVLSTRLIAPSFRSGEAVTSVLAPVVFTVGFYTPLNAVMSFFGHGLSSYAQFLMPLIVLQALAFTSISAAFRSATDAVEGINKRFGSMPIGPLVPLAARMTATLFRFVVSFAAAIVCGYVIGFRFSAGTLHTIGFIAFALLIAVALSVAADVLGALSSSPEATTQALMLPQLILGMLSVGFAPASQFPSWAQWFVRNQPVSQFVYGLRALAGDTTGGAGSVTWSLMGPPLAWAVLLIAVFVPLSMRLSARRP